MKPIVGVIMGSSSDWETMRHAAETLAELGIPFEKEVVSAHRTPDKLYRYASEARERGLEVIIAGAGDDHLQPPLACLAGIAVELVRGPVGGDHLLLEGNAQFREGFGCVAHGLPVGTGAHDDTDDRLH